MSTLRRCALLLIVLICGLACNLTAAPASATATIAAPPTAAPSNTPAVTATVEASDTPLPSASPAPSETPDPLLQQMPAPFTNLTNVSQFFNPVGQPVQTWNGIPIMPEAIAGQEFKPGALYSFRANADIAQAVSFYQPQLSALGYSSLAGPSTGSAGTGSNAQHNSVLDYYKGTQVLLIYIASFDSDPGHVIVVISM